MGIAMQVEDAIDLLLNGYILSKSSALCSALVPIALTGATIHLIVMGFAIMRGEANDPLHTFLWKSFKTALIAGIALSGGIYNSYVVDGINGIGGAIIQSLSGAATVGALLDDLAKPFNDLGQALWSEAVTGLPKFGLMFAAALVAVAEAFLFVVGLGFYLLAKVAVALVFAIGPVFILCAMWPATQKYTESWIGQALNYTLLNVLVAASIGMLMQFASQFASELIVQGGSVNAIKSATALLLCSGALCVVMLNLPQLASALSGGASISGIGRAIGRALTGNSGSKDESKPPGGGNIDESGKQWAGGHKLNEDGSFSPVGLQQGTANPAYQRHTIDHIKKAA